jgi:tetratricopeptide (TPR) repeat protein
MADINANGSVGIGGAPVHRARSLRQTNNPLPFTQMLAGANPTTGPERASLYARGWLLAHYLTFSKERAGQLDQYLALMARGASADDAARQAFGDIGQLEVETEKYLRADKFPYLTLPASAVPIGKVEVTTLSPGGQAIMPLRIRLEAGADENKADLAARIREIAAGYPADELVQLTLAEAELSVGRHAESIAAAERALKANDKSVRAMLVMGQAVQAQAKAKVVGATFTAARGWFNRANRLDPENPGPLLYFYNSFVAEGVRPTANAVAALQYASALAPQDMGLRLVAAKSLLAQGRKAEASKALIPVAYYPHGGRLSEEARRLLDQASN